MMTTAKQIRRVGADGKLYFAFNLWATYEVQPPYDDVFNYQITELEFDEATETEYYRIESAGEELQARFSVQQLELLLAQLPYEIKESGEPVELPLLTEEVKAFYAAKRAELKLANVKENEKLKGTSWDSYQKSLKSLKEKLCYAVSQDDKEQTIMLGNKIKELEMEMENLLRVQGINEKVLRKLPDCPQCFDTGVKDGIICACARESAQKIKTFNALRRLVANTPPKTRAVQKSDIT